MLRNILPKYSEQLLQLSLPFRGQVGAGTVVPFLPGGRKTLLLPIKYNNSKYSVYQACGDSFINEGIFDGTILVSRERFEVSEVTNNRLVIVRIPTGDLTLKRIHFLDDLMVKLSSANKKYKPLYFELELIEVVALVDASYNEHL